MRHVKTAIIVALALTAGACGTEYTMGRRSVKSTVQRGYESSPAPSGLGAGYSTGVTTHTITLLDRTGILLAVLGTAANAVVARQDAIKNARATGKTGTVYYSYETTPVVPGFDTRLYYSFGGGTGFDMDRGGGMTQRFDDNGVDFSELGFRVDYISRPIGDSGHLHWGLAWDTRIVNYDFKTTAQNPLNPADLDIDYTIVYLPVELNLSYIITPRVRATAALEYDPFMGLINVFGLDVHHQYGAGVSGEVMIKPWLLANADLELQRGNEGSSEFTRRVDQWVASVGVSLQIPMRAAK